MSTSNSPLYAIGQDPCLEKILERAKSLEEWIKYLQSKVANLQSVGRSCSEDCLEEFEVAIETLLKDLVLDLCSARRSSSDEWSWLWLTPDYAADLRDFIGRLYCILKLAEWIHEENSQLEDFPAEGSPATLQQQSAQDNGQHETFCTDAEPIQLSQQLQRDDRYQKATLLDLWNTHIGNLQARQGHKDV